jgi:hypothetical protein
MIGQVLPPALQRVVRGIRDEFGDAMFHNAARIRSRKMFNFVTMHLVKVQYNTIQYNAMQCNAIQYNTIQYNTIQYNTIQYNTI